MKSKITIFIAVLLTLAMNSVAESSDHVLVTDSRTSTPFHYINIQGEMNIKIVQEEKQVVTVEGSQFQVDNTVTILRGDTLFVFQANVHKNESKVLVTINIKNISLIEVTGKTNVVCEGLINTDYLTIRTHNGAKVKLDVRALQVDSKATGCSSIELSGFVGSVMKNTDTCAVIDTNNLDAWVTMTI